MKSFDEFLKSISKEEIEKLIKEIQEKNYDNLDGPEKKLIQAYDYSTGLTMFLLEKYHIWISQQLK